MGLIHIKSNKEKRYAQEFRKGNDIQESGHERMIRERHESIKRKKQQVRKEALEGIFGRRYTKKSSRNKKRKYIYTKRRVYIE